MGNKNSTSNEGTTLQMVMRFFSFSVSCFLGFLLASELVFAQDTAPENERQLREGWLVVPEARGGGRGRISLPKDPLEWARLSGELKMPQTEPENFASAPGLKNWRKVEADEQGGFADRELGRGWLAIDVDEAEAGIWLLDVRGAGLVRVNGVPRNGDVYSNGSTEIPIELNEGKNWLIFSGTRGKVEAKLRRVERDVFLSLRDTTFPHVIRNESEDLWGALMVVNATNEPRSNYQLRVSAEGFETTVTDVPSFLPLATQKVPFRLSPKQGLAGNGVVKDQVAMKVELLASVTENESETSGAAVDVADVVDVNWECRDGQQHHVRTFVSQIDGSVQYYGVVPPAVATKPSTEPPGLVLALHGAGVEGSGHAAAYSAKPNLYIIAPTNRRNFGFDWEDWGRWDALEVLDQAEQRFQTNRQRTYLTGHSMGGHGTWHLGTLFPDRFAAIGPSAGWIAFSTYAGGDIGLGDDPLSQTMKRAIATSDTIARVENLKGQGVYILHGDRDDNVPVGQARTMREVLAKFHPDFVYKEQPGAGHWWGNPCCDWPPLFQFFSEHQLLPPAQVSAIQFATPNPAASARCFWATVTAQQTVGDLSRIDLKFDAANLKISGTTENVSRLSFDTRLLLQAEGVPQDVASFKFELDGAEVLVDRTAIADTVEWVKQADGWKLNLTAASADHKQPHRGSGLKEAFRNRFVLVYGTHGDEAENKWMMERARYDAEVFRYRGNASVDVLADHELGLIEADRSVVVYGNASINSAWADLLKSSPVTIEKNKWQLADESENNGSQSVLMLRPRPGSPVAAVAAIGGTDLLAMEATSRIPIFSSGTGYPDLLLAAPVFLLNGYESVRVAGFFGNDWSYESGQWFRAQE